MRWDLHRTTCVKNIHIVYIFSNSLRPRQNDRYFADDIFKCIYINEKFDISIRISLKFVPNGPFDNKLALL